MELEFLSEAPTGKNELFIYLDDEGKTALLSAIKEAEATGHSHLMSKDWGGSNLTITEGSSRSFHKVTVTFSR